MDIKQLKLNGVPFYPKVGVDSIVNADGTASAVDTVVTQGSQNLVTSDAVYDAVNDIEHTPHWSDIQDKPNFAIVATSGDYDDLLNKPVIPTPTPGIEKIKTDDLNITPPVDGIMQIHSGFNEPQNPTWVEVKGLYNGQIGIDVVSNVKTTLSNKQDQLVSGTNIKTINNQSILGSGNIEIQEGGSGSVNSVSYSNNAGDFAPDANGKVTLTIDLALSVDSGKPVTNAAISTKFNSVDDAISNVNSTVTSMTTTLVNHSNAITAIERVLWKDDENQIDKVNGRVDSLSSVVDSALTDIDDCVETIEISNNKLKYTTSGGVTPVDVATIDTVATKNSKNLVTSGAVLNSVGNSFDSKSKYFKGFGLSSVESVFDIHGQLIDPSVNTRVGYIELTIEWFNAKCDAGETDRLVKKHYVVGKEPVIIENSQWDPSGIITDINSYPGNGTDFSLYSQPSFTYSSSGSRIDVQIHLGLLSSKYQVHSITITKAYDPYNVELQLAEAFLSTAQYLYHYTDDPQPGIYVIEGEVILRTNNSWYKIGDAEESPMKPNT